MAELIDPDTDTAWRELRESGGAVVAVRLRDGRRTELALRVCPLRGDKGEPGGYVITAAPDAGGRTLGELAFRQASVSMSIFDIEQRYLRMNDTACRITGRAEADFLGRFYPDTVEDTEHSRVPAPSAESGRDGAAGALRELDPRALRVPGPSTPSPRSWSVSRAQSRCSACSPDGS